LDRHRDEQTHPATRHRPDPTKLKRR